MLQTCHDLREAFSLDKNLFEKLPSGRFKAEAAPLKTLTRYLACRLVFKSMRGGIPTTLRISEVEKAELVKDKYLILVKEHKRDASGPCSVVVEKREMKLLKAYLKLRLDMQKKLPQFRHDFLLVNASGSVATKLYSDINAWGSSLGLKTVFNGELFRRTTNTLANGNVAAMF